MPAPLTPAEITAGLDALRDWRRDGDAITRDVELEDFDAAIAFVVEVAAIARRLDHHPDILVHGYSRVRLTTTTHSAGALTAKDLELAAAVDGLG